MKVSSFLFVSTFSGILSLGAAEIPPKAVFAFGGNNENYVTWHGKTLIESDNITLYPNTALSAKVEKSSRTTGEGWNIFNAWSTSPELPFRREIGILNDGSEVELNFQANQPAYHKKDNVSSFAYSFKVPIERVNGMKYTAIVDRAMKPKTVQDEINDKTPNKILTESKVRWIEFEGNDRKIIFDLGPEGMTSFSDWGPVSIQTMWNIEKTPTALIFSFGVNNTNYGGVINSKIRIYESTTNTDEYSLRHPCKKYGYFDPLPAEKLFCFGAEKHGKKYTDAGLKKYSAEQDFGWLDTDNMKIESASNSGAVYSAVTGSGKKTFRVDLKNPGLYIFTLRCAGYEHERSLFSVSANEKTIIEKLNIPPYTLKNITWSQWLEKGSAELTFEGENWAVSSLGIQLLLQSSEDFKFRRGFWLSQGVFEPSPINSSACFATPPKYAVAVSEIKLPKDPISEPDNIPEITTGAICLPDTDSQNMAWRNEAVIGSIGPGNMGSFTEFDTQSRIERRLKEIKGSGVNTILLNGLLSRHTFESQLGRVEKNIADITKIAHQNDMKIIDHQDLTLLWNLSEGFRIMTANIGWTQMSIDGNMPVRAFCLNNAEFRESFFKYIVDFVKETNIDGLMIDEVMFLSPEYCGCPDCRRKFTEDTGLVLPLDETSPMLFNKASKLWKTWAQWRMRAVGDWSVELRCRLMSVKPYFTIMKYVTHYGFNSCWAPLELGLDLNEAARSCDFIGTEIMSRNVMAANRAVFSMRKAKNALRTAFDCPIFGLVYPMDNDDIAYFGWAMNNMNAQITWMISGQVDSKAYTDFKNNFTLKAAQPVAEIGMLYSIQGRNWEKYTTPTREMIGTSQMLTDRHIMHDFFIEKSMVAEFLMKYRVIMLNSACSLSDKQIADTLNYAKNGGTLFLSATTGTCDQLGIPRKTWPFADMLGINIGNSPKLTAYPFIRFIGKESISYNKPVLNLSVDKNNPPEILAEVLAKDGKVLQPLTVEKSYGKGRIIYCAAELGSANYEAEKTYNDKWDFAINNTISGFFHEMIQKIVLKDTPLSFKPVTVPEKVLTSVYRQTINGQTSATVHFLNATGINMQVGETVPNQPPGKPAWPELQENVVFDISLPSLIKAEASSPEWQGFKPVKSDSLGNGYFRITVPKELLKKYCIVFLRQ